MANAEAQVDLPQLHRGPAQRPDKSVAAKAKDIKRDALGDTTGLLLGTDVITGNVQGRDCAAALTRQTRRFFPWIARITRCPARGVHSSS